MQSLRRLWHNLTSPRTKDKDTARQEYLTRVALVIIGTWLIMLTFLITLGWSMAKLPLEAVARISLIDLPIIVGWWLVQRGHWRWGSFVPPLVFFLNALYGTFSSGLGTPVVFYFIAILLTGMLQGVKAQWFMVALSISSYLTLGWIHGDRSWDVFITYAITVGSSLIGLAFFQWFFISQLQNALKAATGEIKERQEVENALRESEERYRNIFETAAVSIWEEDFGAVKAACDELRVQGVTDFESYLEKHPEFVQQAAQMVQVVDVNKATLKMFGAASKAELLGTLDSIFLPETSQIFCQEVAAIAEGKPFFQGETVNRTLTGERLNVLLTMAIPSEKEKFSNVLVCLMDITARKRIEEQLQASLQEKEVLLKEIHHRVKNNLQVISSLLDLQSATIQEPQLLQAFQDSQQRIRSMALIHENLYRSHDLAQIDIASYAQNLVDDLFRVYGDPLNATIPQVQIEDISLDIDTAVPCGLIISELVANALKYAFPPDRAAQRSIDRPNEIRVALGIKDAKENAQLALLVSDNGVGLPPDLDWQNTPSLGLRLVRLLTQQLRGKITLEQGQGTTFKITFNKDRC